MLIGYPRQRNRVKDFPDLGLEDEKLCNFQKAKYLGVMKEESMNWEEQLKTIKRKIKWFRGNIQAQNLLSQKKLLIVYRTLTETHVVWSCLSKSELESLQKFAKQGMQTNRMSKAQRWVGMWLTQSMKSDKIQQANYCRQSKIGLFSENIKNKSTTGLNISRYSARKIDDFEIPRLNLEYCKKSFGYLEVHGPRSQSKYEILPHWGLLKLDWGSSWGIATQTQPLGRAALFL